MQLSIPKDTCALFVVYFDSNKTTLVCFFPPSRLRQEWMDGCKVSDTAAIAAAGYDPRSVGISVMEAYAAMVFEHG